MIRLAGLMLSLLLILFIFSGKDKENDIVSLCERANLDTVNCPEKLGSLFLPRTFSARAIYVGFSRDDIHVKFLELLIDEVSKIELKPKLNILVPSFEKEDALGILEKYFNNSLYSFINIIPTSSKDTVWVQDYMEILFNTETSKSEILDLPYYNREGEDIPSSVALVCQKKLIPQAQFNADNNPGSGDYGGNIEPITTKILTVGNNLSNETYEILQRITTQEILELNVEWLETGHVDELLTTLPFKENATPCEQALLIASPKLALDLVANSSTSLEEPTPPKKPYSDDFDVWIDHSHCLHVKNKSSSDCLELARANLLYQEIIDLGISNLQNLIEKVHGCRLKEEKFPQLFVPLKKMDDYGTLNDRAISLNPNSVNNIFFYPNLMLAKQPFIPFQKTVDEVLKKYPYKRIYIDDEFAHELNGGIHCATNISYGCAQ